MSTLHRFAESALVGVAGEAVAGLLLQKHYAGWEVRKARKLSEQKAGYDFVLRQGERFVLVEVKTDLHQTPNIAIELYHRGKHEGPGWFFSSKADVLFYLRPPQKLYYCFELPRLRYALRNVSRFPVAAVRNPGFVTDNALVPAEYLHGEGFLGLTMPFEIAKRLGAQLEVG